MRSSFASTLRRLSLACLVATSGIVTMATAAPVETPQEERFIFVADDDEDEGDEEEAPSVWLGIMLSNVEGDLAKHLGSENGILVASVFPDSPADEAGLQEGDILISAGESELKNAKALLAVLNKVEEGGSLQLGLMRKGKDLKLDVKPTKRPAQEEMETDERFREMRIELSELEDLGDSGDAIKGALKALRSGDENDLRVFRFGGPSMVWRGAEDAEVTGDMDIVIVKDDDGQKMEVRVERRGDAPAKIQVKEGDEETTVSEEQLDELPKEVIKIIKPMLGKEGHFHVEVMPEIGGIEIGVDAREMAEKIRAQIERHREGAEEHAGRAREAAERARQVAERARVRVRETVESAEIEELRALVDSLKKEVKELRSKLKESDDE